MRLPPIPLLTLGAAALLAACAANPPTESPDAMLNTIVEEWFDGQLELHPMDATAIGDSRIDAAGLSAESRIWRWRASARR